MSKSFFSQDIRLGSRALGPGHPPFIIAELSGNHKGSLDRALELVNAAKEAGADAVKLQTYTADTITIQSERPEFVVKGAELWDGRTLYDLYKEAHTPWDWHPPIFEKCKELGMECFSSPFDPTAVEFLESLDTPAYKIASFEIVDHGLIELAAKTGKPIIISTGVAELQDIEDAVEVVRQTGNRNLILLKCTSAYPAEPKDANLITMRDMKERFGCLVGLSDHTLGVGVPLASVALGACLIEKHVTLSRDDGAVDSAFSLEPQELSTLCKESKRAWESIGKVNYEVAKESSKKFRRSLYAVKEIKKGETFTRENVRSIRPSNGLHPKYLSEILGKVAKTDVPQGTPLSTDHL